MAFAAKKISINAQMKPQIAPNDTKPEEMIDKWGDMFERVVQKELVRSEGMINLTMPRS